MIRFRCHRCKKRIAVPDGYVGRKVKCPACQIVTIVPDIPSDSAKAGGGQGGQQQGGAREEPAAPAGPVEGASQAMTDDLAQLAAAMGDPGATGGEEQYETYEQVETYEEPAPAAESPKPQPSRGKKGRSRRPTAAPPQPPPPPPQEVAAPEPMFEPDAFAGPSSPPRSSRVRTPGGAGYEWIDWLAIGLQSLGGLLAAGFLYSFIKFIISLFSDDVGPSITSMMSTGQKIELYAMSLGVILAYLLSAFILFAAGRVCYVFKRMAMKVDRM